MTEDTFNKLNIKNNLTTKIWISCDKSEEPNFFATIEECMAFVLDQDHLDITQVEFIRRSLGTWKSQILLNDPDKEIKNND